jgi:hypothetical protein
MVNIYTDKAACCAKRWRFSTRLHSVITKTAVRIFTADRMSHFIFQIRQIYFFAFALTCKSTIVSVVTLALFAVAYCTNRSATVISLKQATHHSD